MKTSFSLLSFLCLLSPGLLAQAPYRVLPEDFNADKEQQMMRAYLREQVHDALDARLAELENLETAGQIQAYQTERLNFLHWTLGEMPERTPLSEQISGTLQGPGFTIEKVIFESRPGFHVTGNLYRPEGDGPFPAILHPCGHSENGKATGVYQKANRLLARNGFIVLCYDPIGQGERKQILNEDGEPTHRGTSEHQELGVAPILLGGGLAGYMVWDGVRAIDYLQSRPDVDPERIGCTGNSGGGNMTSYLMAYDERIVAAAPGCFMTTHRRKNESPGPGDAEQNLFAQVREGFDHPDFILTRAPKPTLILAATKDFVPIEGTWEAFRQAKRVYTKLGRPEAVGLVEANEKHGYSKRLREGAVRFFTRWLQGREIVIFEEENAETLPDATLQCTPDGQVLKLAGARSIFDLYAEQERESASKRPKLTRELVRETAEIRPLAELPEPEVKIHAQGAPAKLELQPEPGITLPALYWEGGEEPPVLIAPDAGKDSAVREAEALHEAGHPVLIVDVRDIGETLTRNWRFKGADYYIAYMLGRSYVGMRTEDLLITARWLAGQSGASSVRLIAGGEIGPPAQHAAALEPDLIDNLQLRGSLPSWRSLMADQGAYGHLHNAVHGALRVYDLPDLEKLRR